MFFSLVKVSIATIGLCLGSAAIAEDPVYFTTDVTGTYYTYDAETIRRYSDNTVDVWIRLDASKDKTVPYRTAMLRLKINCSNNTFGMLAEYEYRANGTVMKSNFFDYPNMVPVPPTTTIDTLLQILCAEQ